jgi:hypothetical protein
MCVGLCVAFVAVATLHSLGTRAVPLATDTGSQVAAVKPIKARF